MVDEAAVECWGRIVTLRSSPLAELKGGNF